MESLPRFTLESYRDLLCFFLREGAHFSSMSEIGKSVSGDIFLRHDLDFSLELALPMARIEHQLDISSTYYVLLSGPYNPCSQASVNAMCELRSLGHELGLHYDLSQYPLEEKQARERLAAELDFLSLLSDSPINTIVMHEPSRGHVDLFESVEGLINPTFYQKNKTNMMYVSDSCRAWRDRSLLDYWQGKTAKDCLLLNLHPESWLAESSQHRLTYLEKTLLPKALESTRRYFMEQVRASWINHVGPVSGYGDEDE